MLFAPEILIFIRFVEVLSLYIVLIIEVNAVEFCLQIRIIRIQAVKELAAFVKNVDTGDTELFGFCFARIHEADCFYIVQIAVGTQSAGRELC